MLHGPGALAYPERQPMADEKKAEKVDKPKLARASESGDAGVQNLLAQRMGYSVNGMDDKVAEVDAQLAELGFAV